LQDKKSKTKNIFGTKFYGQKPKETKKDKKYKDGRNYKSDKTDKKW